MRTRALAAVLSLIVLLAACKDDDDAATTTIPVQTTAASTSTTAPSTTAQTGTTTTIPKDPAKAARAKAAVLQPADLPTGFRPADPDEALDQDTTFHDLVTCLGVEAPNRRGSAASPTFVRGQGTNIASSVEYFSEPSARAIATELASPKGTTCASEALSADIKRNAPEGFATGTAQVAPLDFPKLGDATFAFRVNSTVEPTPGLKIPINHDLVIVFKGEAVSRLTFLAPGEPLDPALERTLTEAVVGRS